MLRRFSQMFRKPLPPPTQYDLELQDWRKQMKQTIRQYRQEFEELRMQEENDFIEQLNEEHRQKAESNRIRRLETVIRISNRTQNMLKAKEEREAQKRARKTAFRMRMQEELSSKAMLIQALNIDSATWIHKDTVDEQIREKLIVPHTLNQTDYYTRLRELSFLSLSGKPYSKYDLYNNRRETQIRNSILYPYFVEIRSAIKMLTYTPLVKLHSDYEASKPFVEDVKALREKYQKLKQAYHSKSKNPKVFIQRTYKQLKHLDHLLKNWGMYIEAMKMEDGQIKLMKDKVDSELGFLSRVEDEEEKTWEQDMNEPNPETSDYFELNKQDSEDFMSSMKAKEEQTSVNLEDLFPESEKESEMYTGGKPDPAIQIDSRSALDTLINEISRELSDAQNMFDTFNDTFEEITNPEKSDVKELVNSIVIGKLKAKVETINDQALDLADRWNKSEILKLIDSILHRPVDEPQLLIKVFYHHRYDPPTFN